MAAQEKNFKILEKLEDGSYITKHPETNGEQVKLKDESTKVDYDGVEYVLTIKEGKPYLKVVSS